jgi:uncharacterized protein YraI
MLLLASCAPGVATPSPIVTEEPGIPVTGLALVQRVEIQILDSNPIQVNAIVRGELPDTGCTTIASVEQALEGNTFKLRLITTTDPVTLCAQALTPFEQVVPLDVSNLLAGPYVVNANGVVQAFELLPRDVSQFKQTLVNALNARDYELLKTLMDGSFTIGYWRSEGTSNTPEQAIEQLQRNLLSAAAPIAPDLSKDLVALLGMDPVTIAGPEVIEASSLFTSGWGPEGKDEAILFTAQHQNGELYWHGLLLAQDGFAKPEPIVTQPPVDMNAYPTNVEYVMAQRDVRLRSGPGTQFAVISYLAAGQTAKVTGVSANGYWWRVICPDDGVGSCWVSADPSLTRPTDGIPTTPPPNPTGIADVQTLVIQILESYPLQVNAIARGQLPDAGCTTISGVSQKRSGNTFTVTLMTEFDPKALCALMLTPFEQVIPLEVGSLLPGTYMVRVNNVETSFQLPDAVYPTDVSYVMAQRDVTMYSGPGTQHGAISSIASGQIAKVTGVSGDGSWWRVMCPDDTVGSCWVSANPSFTEPANAPE